MASGIEPTYPFHLARAYGLPSARPARPVGTQPGAQPAQAARPADAAKPVQPVQRAEQPTRSSAIDRPLRITAADHPRETSGSVQVARRAYAAFSAPKVNAAPAPSPSIARVVAARVPGGIDFTADDPKPTGSLSIYRHPADRNTAATGTQLGRMVDFDG